MQKQSVIQYLPHAQIDKTKWDACIAAAPNGLIYAHSWYLDEIVETWDALVMNDYESVMPLPYRKKYGVLYLFHPPFVAQLGLFGNELRAGLLQDFLTAIPKKFRYWDFPLNHQNLFTSDAYPLYMRNNFVLPLKPAYEELYKAFRENVRRNMKKSGQYGCVVKKNIPVQEVVTLAQAFTPDAAAEDLAKFERVFNKLAATDQAICYGIYSAQGQLLSSAAFLFSHRRAYYILVGNHPNGRMLGASHALINAFIQDHAGHDMLLDFEGSDMRNLAFFYSSFGAHEEPYAAIRLNRLPWWLRWMKK